jgi:hypothetical protein
MLQLNQLPASVHAEHAWAGVSDKYSFLSTAHVVEALGSKGIHPYTCKESYPRIEGKRGFTKHMLRFRPANVPKIVGGVHPEVVITNAHDTASSFAIELGLFRLVCSNGMVVSAGAFESFRVRHVGATIDSVLEATYRIIDQFPQVESTVQRFQSIQLTDPQREAMAQLAMGLRWDADKVPFESARLLATRRTEDQGKDLWSTYNVIQENLLKGQSMRYRGRFYHDGASRNPRSSREVKSIDSDLTLNRGLWAIAEQYATA